MLAKGAVAVIAMVLLAGCVVHEDRPVAADPHRDWWSAHHGQDAYERSRAEREHRDWCGRTPDRSCEGWR